MFIFVARRMRYWKFINPRRISNESHILGARNILIGLCRNGVVLPVHDRVRKNLRGKNDDLSHGSRCRFFIRLFVCSIDPTGVVLVRDLLGSSEAIAL